MWFVLAEAAMESMSSSLSLTRFEWSRSHMFKFIFILLIGVSMDVTLVECSPALSHLTRSQLAPIDKSNIYPQRYRSIISTLSTLTEDPNLNEDVSGKEETDDDESDQWPRELSRSLKSGPIAYRQRMPTQPLRVMTKKALSLFAHWKPMHYTSNEDNSMASDVISAVARGHSRPVGGPLRWGRRWSTLVRRVNNRSVDWQRPRSLHSNQTDV